MRARARASGARYSRIITPELPAGPDARNAGSPVRDGLISAERRAADNAITGYVAWRSASSVAESRADDRDERVLGGVVDRDPHRLSGGDEGVHERRVHLRHGPQRERVLHPR